MIETIIYIALTVCGGAVDEQRVYYKHFKTYDEAVTDKRTDPYPEHCVTTILEATPVQEIPDSPPSEEN